MTNNRNHGRALFERSQSRAPSPDAMNGLFDYDVGIDEMLKNTDSGANQRREDPAIQRAAALGLDEEVKVTRKKQPVAKLDEAR
jgi:replication fork protection complex subunit Csm3/Swi3